MTNTTYHVSQSRSGGRGDRRGIVIGLFGDHLSQHEIGDDEPTAEDRRGEPESQAWPPTERRMLCGWRCGVRLIVSRIRAHFTEGGG